MTLCGCELKSLPVRCQTFVTCLVGVSSDVTVMMSESRQQNTEVRLAVGSIADKVDRLTEKVRCSKYLKCY